MPETVLDHHDQNLETPPSEEVGDAEYPQSTELGSLAVQAESAEAPKPTLEDLTSQLVHNRQATILALENGEISDPYAAVDTLEVSFLSRDLRTSVEDGDYTASQFNALFEEARATEKYIKSLNLESFEPDEISQSILEMTPPDKLQAAYRSESDNAELKSWLENRVDTCELWQARRTTQILSKLCNETPETLPANEAAMADPLISRFADGVPYANSLLADMPYQEHAESSRDFMYRYDEKVNRLMTGQLRMPKEFVDEFQQSIRLRTRLVDKDGKILQGNDMGVDSEKLQAYVLPKAFYNIAEVGRDTILKLREKCGTRNIDIYQPEQLERMSKLVDGDPELLEYLKDGDVSVVFMDGSGDNNGGIAQVPQILESPNGRTLFFEINEPGDLNRHMALLKMNNVLPSTFIWVAHGGPGGMRVGEGQDMFVVTNANEVMPPGPEDVYPLPEQTVKSAKNLQRLTGEFMQPSRGIDDPEEEKGRRRVIMVSCSQAAGLIRVHNRDPGQTYFEDEESMLESLAKAINNPDVDVYGVDIPAGITVNDGEFQYMSAPDRPAQATKVVSRWPGTADPVKVDKIGLWKKKAEQGN